MQNHTHLPSNLRAALFDMDGTLYQSDEVNTLYREDAWNMLARHNDLDLETAKSRFAERVKQLQKENGYKPSLTRTLYSFGIEWKIWNQSVIENIDIRSLLKPDPELAERLMKLKNHLKLGVVTNNSNTMTNTTLVELGIRDCFDDIVTITESRLMKPDRGIYEFATKRIDISPIDCLVVGDRFEIDLEPAQEMGMTVRLVRTRDELFAVFDEMEALVR